MGLVRPLSVTLLVGVAVVAHFALNKQAEWSGLFSLHSVFAYKNRILNNTNIPIKLPLTGIDALDNYFAFMAAFFWGALDSRNVRAHLQSKYILGTLGSVWVLMLTEGHRNTSSAGFLFTTYVMELFGEFLGIGSFTPIWCIAHLLWTARPTTSNDLLAPKKSLGALGYAFVFGHVVPTIILSRTKPDGEGLASQPLWAVLRLFHPVFVFAFWKIFQTTQSIFSGPEKSSKISIDAVRKFYFFSALTSGIFHAMSLAILFSHDLFSGWLRKDVVAALDVKTFLVPAVFWGKDFKYSSANPIPFDLGVATFLQWDNICAASAIVIWAATLYVEAAGQSKTQTLGSRFNVGFQSLLVALLAGPGATAAYLMLERDSIIADSSTQQKPLKLK